MDNKTEIIDVNANQNHEAMRSIMVMEQWGNGETYNEATWIERGRQAVRQTMEGMFELGRALIVLKEHTEHGRFTEIVKTQFGIDKSTAARLMSATQRFATPQMQKAQAKLMDLGKTKLLELLVEDDVTLTGLAEGETIDGVGDLDDIDKMTTRELRIKLRESRADYEARGDVIKSKERKINQLEESLEKAQRKAVKEPEPADVANELHMMVGTKEIAIRSQVAQMGELFGQMAAHETAHGLSHRAKMVGVINQIVMDLNHLRDVYNLPNDIPEDETPEWLQPESE